MVCWATRLTLIRPWCEASHCFRSHHLFILVPPSSTIPFRPRLIGQSQLGWSLLWGPDCMDDAIDQSVKEKKWLRSWAGMGWMELERLWWFALISPLFLFSLRGDLGLQLNLSILGLQIPSQNVSGSPRDYIYLCWILLPVTVAKTCKCILGEGGRPNV